MEIGSVPDWANLVVAFVTLVLGAAGLWLAENLRRKFRLELAHSRLKAYAALWATMKVARPSRERFEKLGPMTAAERAELHEKFVDWYFDLGYGMLLEEQTREMFLAAKDNLICPDEKLQPAQLVGSLPNDAAGREAARGTLSSRQLSLLRTNMKADLEVFGRWYYSGLNREDQVFLEHCGVDVRKRPWKNRRPRGSDPARIPSA